MLETLCDCGHYYHQHSHGCDLCGCDVVCEEMIEDEEDE